MNPADVRARVAHIEAMRGDDEQAHSEEDALYREVLHAIGSGKATYPAACARIALLTEDIDFARWCA